MSWLDWSSSGRDDRDRYQPPPAAAAAEGEGGEEGNHQEAEAADGEEMLTGDGIEGDETEDFDQVVSNVTATLPMVDDADEECNQYHDHDQHDDSDGGDCDVCQATENRSVASFPSYSSDAADRELMPPPTSRASQQENHPIPTFAAFSTTTAITAPQPTTPTRAVVPLAASNEAAKPPTTPTPISAVAGNKSIPAGAQLTPGSVTSWMRRLYSVGRRARSSPEEEVENGRAKKKTKEDNSNDGVEALTERLENRLKIQQEKKVPETEDDAASLDGESTTSFTKSMERVWAKELLDLSPNARDKINEELHGVFSKEQSGRESVIEETPELVEEALREMNDEIESDTIPVRMKQGHTRAIELHDQYLRRCRFSPSSSENNIDVPDEEVCRCFVRTAYFRLRFLRADRFTPRKAAARYCKSLNMLYKYFGDKALTRQLYVSDLTGTEIKSLRNEGILQLSHSRDSVGRRIFYCFCQDLDYSAFVPLTRIDIFLLYSVVAEDVMSQKNGIVFVTCFLPTTKTVSSTLSSLSNAVVATNSGADGAVVISQHGGGDFNNISSSNNNEKNDMMSIGAIRDLVEGLPVNVTAMHVCVPNEPKYKFGAQLLMMFVNQEMRSRSRIHSGSSIMETMYSLQNFGILGFPLTHTGMIKTKSVKDFIKARTAIDVFRQERCKELMQDRPGTIATFTTDDPPGVECPEINCVIFGNSKKYRHHKGNLNFRDVIRAMVLLEEESRTREARSAARTAETNEAISGGGTIHFDNKDVVLSSRLQAILFIDKVIDETSIKFVFRIHETKNCWYKMVDRSELRKQISQVIRDVRRAIAAEATTTATAQQKQQKGISYDNQNTGSRMGLDPRRYGRGGGCL